MTQHSKHIEVAGLGKGLWKQCTSETSAENAGGDRELAASLLATGCNAGGASVQALLMTGSDANGTVELLLMTGSNACSA